MNKISQNHTRKWSNNQRKKMKLYLSSLHRYVFSPKLLVMIFFVSSSIDAKQLPMRFGVLFSSSNCLCGCSEWFQGREKCYIYTTVGESVRYFVRELQIEDSVKRVALLAGRNFFSEREWLLLVVELGRSNCYFTINFIYHFWWYDAYKMSNFMATINFTLVFTIILCGRFWLELFFPPFIVIKICVKLIVVLIFFFCIPHKA